MFLHFRTFNVHNLPSLLFLPRSRAQRRAASFLRRYSTLNWGGHSSILSGFPVTHLSRLLLSFSRALLLRGVPSWHTLPPYFHFTRFGCSPALLLPEVETHFAGRCPTKSEGFRYPHPDTCSWKCPVLSFPVIHFTSAKRARGNTIVLHRRTRCKHIS